MTYLQKFHKSAQGFYWGFGHGFLHCHVKIHCSFNGGAKTVCIKKTLKIRWIQGEEKWIINISTSIKQVLSFVPYMTRQLTVAHSQQRAYLSTTQSKPGIPKLNETLLLADTMKLPMTHLIIWLTSSKTIAIKHRFMC